MISLKKLSLLPLVAAVFAVAEPSNPLPEKAPYAVSATAVQDGDLVSVEIKFLQHKADGEDAIIMAPKIRFKDGQQAYVSVSTAEPSTRPKGEAKTSDIWEGARVDVIKALGREEAILVICVFQEGRIVFAKTQNIQVTKGKFQEGV
jgi:hypothetical protein